MDSSETYGANEATVSKSQKFHDYLLKQAEEEDDPERAARLYRRAARLDPDAPKSDDAVPMGKPMKRINVEEWNKEHFDDDIEENKNFLQKFWEIVVLLICTGAAAVVVAALSGSKNTAPFAP